MKKIEGSERVKVQKVISKIEKGDFDENDIDNLLMKLRAFSNYKSLFSEIAHFVAHNDERNKGMTHEVVEMQKLLIEYLFIYKSKNLKFDVFKPFPSYIKRVMKYQLDKVDDLFFVERFGFKKNNFARLIDTLFVDDSLKKNSLLDILSFHKMKNYEKDKLLNAIGFLISYLDYPSMCTQKEIFDSIAEVLLRNNLLFSIDKLKLQEDKIILSVLYLMNGTRYNLKEYGYGYCNIYMQKIFRGFSMYDLDTNHQEVFRNKEGEFSKLSLVSKISVEIEGIEADTTFELITTDLIANMWCTEKLLKNLDYTPHVSFMEDETANDLVIDAKLSSNILINEDFKLDLE